MDHRQENKRRRLEENDATASLRTGEPGEWEDRPSNMRILFSAEEIAVEERKPKRKVAVMIGYAGTGYHGMQISHDQKTIEGDLFAAFVAAGAISKVNANDVKKSSLVRCARTDKGVHAAGNVISLKLIIEDEDVKEKINANLPSQIRVWEIQRTNNGFNCYQQCDSRWYEYLMPSYALLPPHPDSFLGQETVKSAKAHGSYDDMVERLQDVKGYWEEVHKKDVQPVLARLDPEVKQEVLRKLYLSEVAGFEATTQSLDGPVTDTAAPATLSPSKTEEGKDTTSGYVTAREENGQPDVELGSDLSPADRAVREIKALYIVAKRRYRVTPARVQNLQAALDKYVGTHNFHNYTIRKTFDQSSAKRHIKSFVDNPTPIQIRDTEGLSLKVHGQSFMMHQIRKMVAMAAMLVRCGSSLTVIDQSYGKKRISIPKAPGLGLLLERPVFENYSKKARETLGKDPIEFDKYEKEMQEFKDREIYARIWDVEERKNAWVFPWSKTVSGLAVANSET